MKRGWRSSFKGWAEKMESEKEQLRKKEENEKGISSWKPKTVMEGAVHSVGYGKVQVK